MKIILSKTKWEEAGIKAGWLKKAEDQVAAATDDDIGESDEDGSCKCWECGKVIPEHKPSKVWEDNICRDCFESLKGDRLRDEAKDAKFDRW